MPASADRSARGLGLAGQDPASALSCRHHCGPTKPILSPGRHLEGGMLQQKTRTRAHLHIPRDQHRTHSSVRDLLATKDRFASESRSVGDLGSGWRTTAVSFERSSCVCNSQVSSLLRFSAGPRSPLPPFLVRRDLGRHVRPRVRCWLWGMFGASSAAMSGALAPAARAELEDGGVYWWGREGLAVTADQKSLPESARSLRP